jgi:transposase
MNKSHNFKISEPCRTQIEMNLFSLDQLIAPDHKVRAIWDFVDQMDTRPCFMNINSFCGEPGRPASSPKVLFALWLYSILDGNSSARKLEELCKNHLVYQWLAGGIPINRTMLAEFRSNNSIKFEDLLTSCLAVMVQAGILQDTDFSQDGTRVKANAGIKSYRREESLLKLKKDLLEYVKDLDIENAVDGYDKRKKIAYERIAKDRMNRVDQALKNLESAREVKKENRKKCKQPPSEAELKNVRASTTDPEVRKMKMGDGGFRLAYNVQFATGMNSRVIYGVDVVNTLDPSTAPRMMCRVHSRLRKLGLPEAKNWIADAAYSSKDDVEQATILFPNCRYYAPPKPKKGIDPKKPVKKDSEAIKRWRQLIDKEDVKSVYRHRSSTAEFSNAQVKNKLDKFPICGLIKVKGMALLHVIAHNIFRYFDLISDVEEVVAV